MKLIRKWDSVDVHSLSNVNFDVLDLKVMLEMNAVYFLFNLCVHRYETK